MKSSSPVPSDRNSERWSPLLEPTRGDETEGYIGYSWLRNLRRKSGHVALSSNFRFRWCRSRTPIWTRATVHKWSNDRISTQTCHLLCNYVLSSSLLRFPLARLITVSCTFFLADTPAETSLFSFLPLSMSSYRFAALVEEDSYRTVTRLPLNPSEWTVPPWRTYRSNFSPSPVRSTCSLKGGESSIYLPLARYQAACAAFEIYLSRGSDPCPLRLFLMDPRSTPFHGFTSDGSSPT